MNNTMDDNDKQYLFALCITDGILEEMTEEQRKSIILTITQILKKNQVRIITSSDAHCPEDVGYKIKELNEYIKRC